MKLRWRSLEVVDDLSLDTGGVPKEAAMQRGVQAPAAPQPGT